MREIIAAGLIVLLSASLALAFNLEGLIKQQIGETVEKEITKQAEERAAEEMEQKEKTEAQEIKAAPALAVKGEPILLATLKAQVDLKQLLAKLKAQGAKIKTQYAEYDLAISGFGFTAKMKGRSWTKAPNMSRFEILEPESLVSTTINNGDKSVYINNKGEAFKPNKSEMSRAAYQDDFTKFFDDFDFSLAAGTKTHLTLRGAPKKDTQMADAVKYVDYVVDRKSFTVPEYYMAYKGMEMKGHGVVAYAKDENGVQYMKNLRLSMEPDMGEESDMPFRMEMVTEMTTTKTIINAPMSDDYFAIE